MLPEEFLLRMQEKLGEEFPQFLESYEKPRWQALRLNSLKKTESGESMEKALTALFHMEKVPWADGGFYYDAQTFPGKHPYHETGLYYVQEPSAMAPVGFLNVTPGERVLDLCAAPGGKSTQIGAMLRGKGFLLCNEINPSRAKILSENVERMGIANACVTNETPEKLAEAFPEYFDKILVDAPCSGEGMFRKNELAQTEWSPENVQLCGERQDAILNEAAKMLRPGGRLVYSTCTFADWENEGTIQRFLQSHPEFHLVAPLEFHTGNGMDADGATTFEGELRIYPHKVRGEGHFLAVLKKDGEAANGYKVQPARGFIRPIKETDCKEWMEFARETLRRPIAACAYGAEEKGWLHRFGDNLYLTPEEFPSLNGLKVLRPGLHLGECKKNRFEPSHALALALGAGDVKHVFRTTTAEMLPSAYLNGRTFPAEGEKGWYLILVDGISLGWGKLAGGIMKNHYPKGLRKEGMPC